MTPGGGVDNGILLGSKDIVVLVLEWCRDIEKRGQLIQGDKGCDKEIEDSWILVSIRVWCLD